MIHTYSYVQKRVALTAVSHAVLQLQLCFFCFFSVSTCIHAVTEQCAKINDVTEVGGV